MKFYNQVLSRALEITQSPPAGLKVLVSEKCEFPSLGSDTYGNVLNIPKPIKKKNGFVLEGLVFEDSDLGRTLMMKMLMSSVEHLSIHSIISDFSLYNTWLKGKDPKIAVFVIDLIEDLCVRIHARSKLKGLLPNMAIANAISYDAVALAERIDSPQFLLQSALLSFLIAGRYRFLLPSSVKKDVLTILTTLLQFEKHILQRNDRTLDKWWTDGEIKSLKLKLADGIYKRLEKYGSPQETAYLPYTDIHKEVERVNEALTLQIGESIDVLADTFRTLGLQYTSDKSVRRMMVDSFRQEAENLLYDLVMEQRWKRKVAQHYSKLAEDTAFDEVTFPEEDYAEYCRAYSDQVGSVRKYVEQLRLLKNDLSSDDRQEMGELDIQEAIQAIASQKMGKNMYIRDDYLSKSEAWGILLDISHSLRPYSIAARDMAIALSEVAKELISDKQSWGLYAFSSSFVVVKDMNEEYNQNVKARIGAMPQGGLSYIPDALQLGANIVVESGREHNFLFVISDGVPSGYPNIEEKLRRTVSNVMRSGVTIISAGIGANHLQKYLKGTSIKADGVYDLLSKFTSMYYALSTN